MILTQNSTSIFSVCAGVQTETPVQNYKQEMCNKVRKCDRHEYDTHPEREQQLLKLESAGGGCRSSGGPGPYHGFQRLIGGPALEAERSVPPAADAPFAIYQNATLDFPFTKRQ